MNLKVELTRCRCTQSQCSCTLLSCF